MRTQVLLLIPGNPGDAYYYRGFAECLRARGHEVALFDHARLNDPPGMVSYAKHQARCLERYLAHSQRTVEDVEIVLIGHSIGSYLAHLIDTHRLLPIARSVFLFPFLAKPSTGARAALAGWRYLGPCFVRLLRCLPLFVLRALLRRAGVSEDCEHVVEMVRGDHAFSYPAMGRCEYIEVARRPDPSYLARESTLACSGRLSCLLARDDRWTAIQPDAQLLAISRELDGDVKHAFVLDPASWPPIVRAIEEELAPRSRRQASLSQPWPTRHGAPARAGFARAARTGGSEPTPRPYRRAAERVRLTSRWS